MKLILGSQVNATATNVNYQVGLELNNSNTLFSDSIVSEIVDESVQFQIDRNNCSNYIVYGKIESLIDDSLSFDSFNLISDNYNFSIGYAASLIPLDSDKFQINNVTGNTVFINDNNNTFINNDIILLYKTPTDFFVTKVLDIVNTGSTVMIYLDMAVPNNDITYSLIPSSASYKRNYVELLGGNFLRTYNSAFSTNIFNNQITQFNTYKNIILSGLTDNFNFPVTQLFMKINNPALSGEYFYENNTYTDINSQIIDIVNFDLNQLLITNIDNLLYTFNSNNIDYFYPTTFPIDVQYYSGTVSVATTGTTFSYPSYAFIFNNGDVTYKDLLDIGISENGIGLNYPFINNYNYLYNDIKFLVRRNVPIFDYTTTDVSSSDIVYDETLINSSTGGQRLC